MKGPCEARTQPSPPPPPPAPPPLTSTWTKHQNLYCHSYGYRAGGHWFSEASVGAALQRCADDSGCAGIGEWNCGDGQYRYCGKVGWGLDNYGAGRCTWERPRPWEWALRAASINPT